MDALFVDFQNAVIGTPLIDLFYFFTTSVSTKVLATSRDELVFAYHEALSTLLETMDYKGYIPTLNELQVEILRRSSMELYMGLTLAPYARISEPRVITAVQPTLYKPEYLQQLKNHGKIILAGNKEFIQGQLKRFDALGTLDYTGDENRIRGAIKTLFTAKT